MASITYSSPPDVPPSLIRWVETIDDDAPRVPEAWQLPQQLSPLDSAQARRAWRSGEQEQQNHGS